MHKGFLSAGSLIGALSVVLGAFAAHGLKKIVPPDVVATFETGVRYQFYHGFALLFTGILFSSFPGKKLRWAGLLFIAGIVLFSGSLYLLTALKANHQVGLAGVGIITPFGGLLMVGGWLMLFLGIIGKTEKTLPPVG